MASMPIVTQDHSQVIIPCIAGYYPMLLKYNEFALVTVVIIMITVILLIQFVEL